MHYSYIECMLCAGAYINLLVWHAIVRGKLFLGALCRGGAGAPSIDLVEFSFGSILGDPDVFVRS